MHTTAWTRQHRARKRASGQTAAASVGSLYLWSGNFRWGVKCGQANLLAFSKYRWRGFFGVLAEEWFTKFEWRAFVCVGGDSFTSLKMALTSGIFCCRSSHPRMCWQSEQDHNVLDSKTGEKKLQFYLFCDLSLLDQTSAKSTMLLERKYLYWSFKADSIPEAWHKVAHICLINDSNSRISRQGKLVKLD